MNFFLKYIILFLFILSQLFSFCQNNNDVWLGWRGLEKEGVQTQTSIPTTWNDTTNILWKTFIPGAGHSSPVVTNDSVIITTAYKAEENKVLENIIKITLYVLLLIIVLLYFSFILKTFKSINDNILIKTVNIGVFSFILGFIVYFTVLGQAFNTNYNNDHITQIYKWIYSGMFTILCIALSTFTIKQSNRSRLFFIIISVSFLFLFIILRPSPDYYTLFGDNYHVVALQKSILYFVLAISIIAMTFLVNKKNHRIPELSIPGKYKLFTKYISGALIIGAFILGFYGIGLYRMIRYPNPDNIFTLPYLDLYFRDSNLFVAVIIIGISLWAFFYQYKNIKDLFFNSNTFSIAILLIAILSFSQINFLKTENEYVRAVICLDKDTGKEKWKVEVFQGFQPNLHPDNSPATPTPVVIGNKILAYFGTPGLVCIDLEGNLQWKKSDLPFEDIHGIGASPVYADNLIVLLNDMPESPYITAIDINSGKQVWHTPRIPWEGFHGAHRTPIIKTINKKKIIIAWGIHGITGYDLISGKELWNTPIFNTVPQIVASIISYNDTLFLPDPNNFCAISFSSLFNGSDSLIWSSNLKHKGPICSSPVLFNNLLFAVSDNGFAICMDALNGNVKWREKLEGIYMASSTIIDSNLYLSNTSGMTTIIEAKESFRKIAENYLNEPIYASLAPTQNKLFIRTTSHVWCIQKK